MPSREGSTSTVESAAQNAHVKHRPSDIDAVRAALSAAVVDLKPRTASSVTSSTKNTFVSQSGSSAGTDSGYVSQANSPDEKKIREETFDVPSRTLFPKKTTKLKAYDIEIPKPTQNRFSDLKELFDQPLYTFLTRKKIRFTAIAIKLKVLGVQESAAKAWIIVTCEKAVSKTIKQFFNQPRIKAEYQPSESDLPSFGLIVCDRPPRLLATWHENGAHGVYCRPPADYPATLCGTMLQALNADGVRFATLGGLIEVTDLIGDSKIYGLTAGHIVSTDLTEQSDPPEDDLSEESRRQVALESWEVDPGGDKPAVLGDPFDSNAEEEFELDLEYEISDATLTDDDEGSTAQGEEQIAQSLIDGSKLGHIITHSGEHRESGHSTDWALVEIDEVYTSCQNLLTRPDNKGPYYPGSKQLTEVASGDIFDEERDRPVSVLRGTPGIRWGSLSKTSSLIMIAPGKRFIETYTLTLPGRSVLKAGDSGAWVVDCFSQEVYGHVVASDIFGEIFVVPLDQTFRDISNVMCADSVKLPQGVQTRLRHVPSIFELPGPQIDYEGASTPPPPPKRRASFIDSAYGSATVSPANATKRLRRDSLEFQEQATPVTPPHQLFGSERFELNLDSDGEIDSQISSFP